MHFGLAVTQEIIAFRVARKAIHRQPARLTDAESAFLEDACYSLVDEWEFVEVPQELLEHAFVDPARQRLLSAWEVLTVDKGALRNVRPAFPHAQVKVSQPLGDIGQIPPASPDQIRGMGVTKHMRARVDPSPPLKP